MHINLLCCSIMQIKIYLLSGFLVFLDFQGKRTAHVETEDLIVKLSYNCSVNYFSKKSYSNKALIADG